MRNSLLLGLLARFLGLPSTAFRKSIVVVAILGLSLSPAQVRAQSEKAAPEAPEKISRSAARAQAERQRAAAAEAQRQRAAARAQAERQRAAAAEAQRQRAAARVQAESQRAATNEISPPIVISLPSNATEKPLVPSNACAVAVAKKLQGTCIPPMTSVRIELAEALSSRTSITGETFAISLAYPVVIDGREVVPAGAKGRGEIIHAKKTGVGVGGELVLAARYLSLGDRQLRLRSMKLNGAGRDQQGLAFAVGVAVGLPAMFIRGKHIDVPTGAFADAKTAEAFWLDTVGAEVGTPSSASNTNVFDKKRNNP